MVWSVSFMSKENPAVRNFALIGAAGYVAPRHMKAIRETGNRLVAAVDPHDSVGILDQYAPEARYFREIERFDRHLDKLRRGVVDDRVHLVSVCSPNFLHDAHCRLALRQDADVICEKPVVISPWNLDGLSAIEKETGHRIYTVLQLRLHPALLDLKRRVAAPGNHREVLVTYITPRGAWYHASWKGEEERSGGIGVNIGIHVFDLLLWLFGRCHAVRVHAADSYRMAGVLELERARVRWLLSVSPRDIAADGAGSGPRALRSLAVDGEVIEFTAGFEHLHTRVYEEILAARGFGLDEARPSIELAYRIRKTAVSHPDESAHPLARIRSS